MNQMEQIKGRLKITALQNKKEELLTIKSRLENLLEYMENRNPNIIEFNELSANEDIREYEYLKLQSMGLDGEIFRIDVEINALSDLVDNSQLRR